MVSYDRPSFSKKEELRQHFKQKRLSFVGEVKHRADREILSNLETLAVFCKADIIAFYVSLLSEVDTRIIIQKYLKSKIIAVPKIEEKPHLGFYHLRAWSDLRLGKMGILEPVSRLEKIDLSAIQLIIVPGIAFDRKGYRLGFGEGYTDFLLAQIHSPKIGLAYEWQVVPTLPRGPLDQAVDIIITDKTILTVSKK